MLSTRARASHTIFVLQLHTDNRSPILPEKTLDLAANLPIEAAHLAQIFWIVAAHRNLLIGAPIGEAAIARLTVIPGTDARVNVEAVLVAQLDKTTQIPRGAIDP